MLTVSNLLVICRTATAQLSSYNHRRNSTSEGSHACQSCKTDLQERQATTAERSLCSISPDTTYSKLIAMRALILLLETPDPLPKNADCSVNHLKLMFKQGILSLQLFQLLVVVGTVCLQRVCLPLECRHIVVPQGLQPTGKTTCHTAHCSS